MFLSLIIWLGGIIFFSFVMAPKVFGILMPVTGGQRVAGEIIGKSLQELHWAGILCGVLFLVCATALRKTFRDTAIFLVLAMLLLTAVSQFAITPRMQAIRSGTLVIDSREENGGQLEFQRLHDLSVGLEGAVLLLGLGVVWLTAKQDD